jgi:hypothetical protein
MHHMSRYQVNQVNQTYYDLQQINHHFKRLLTNDLSLLRHSQRMVLFIQLLNQILLQLLILIWEHTHSSIHQFQLHISLSYYNQIHTIFQLMLKQSYGHHLLLFLLSHQIEIIGLKFILNC